ncbi:MAG: hypothetical protein H0W01_02135 [Pseudonocardiales bacterium]|nr:hypothetical protein [Pseudonocardiales bacterium]
MRLVLDAGALVAVDRRDRTIGALLRVAQQERVPALTSAAVVAQVWRDGSRQANLARILAGVRTEGLSPEAGRQIGILLRRSRTADVVDGHIAVLATPGDRVLTGDTDDITALLATRVVDAVVQRV